MPLSPTINPQTIYITRHSAARWLHRYEEENHVPYSKDDIARARVAMRDTLMLCCVQNPPLEHSSSRSSRKYHWDEMVFVVASDYSAVITFYPKDRPLMPKRTAKDQRKAKKRHKVGSR